MDKSPPGTPMLVWLAVALSSVAVIALTIVGGLIYVARWLSSNAFAFNNPAYMSLVVVGALILGLVLMGGFLIAHDAVDAWGDGFKAKSIASASEQMDPATRLLAAQTAERAALARKHDRDGITVRPSYADEALQPWPAQENGGTHPPEFTGG